jgi:hypothetical protein
VYSGRAIVQSTMNCAVDVGRCYFVLEPQCTCFVDLCSVREFVCAQAEVGEVRRIENCRSAYWCRILLSTEGAVTTL